MLKKWIQRISPIRSDSNERVEAAKKRIIKQGALILFVVLVMSVLLFAMTTAWFTNVIGAGDLTFRAEAWGFDGKVNVSGEPIKAAPGDSGIISLRLQNTGEVPSLATVSISKAFMDTELQKRVYFYADKPMVVNGELVQKQYLSNSSGYSYGLFPEDKLILEEMIHTDVQLKWEWVYDVVGYYFRATENNGEYLVEEYLRPVEYSYDNALYDAEGNLLKVDAQTDVLTFLANLTATDGYPGAFRVVTQPGSGTKMLMDENGDLVQTTYGWYPIDRENNIWLCLCKKDEIARNTAWDTAFGSGADQMPKKFQARITVTGEQWLQQAMEVTDQTELKNAINENNGQVIKLTQDMVLTETIVLQGGQQAVVDLGGHQITATTATIFDLKPDAQLTVTNGAIVGNKNETIAVHTMDGEVTLNNVQISDVFDAIKIEDYKTTAAQGANSAIRIINSTISSERVTVIIWGDGEKSEGMTTLLVQNSVLTSRTYNAILGNGSVGANGRYGTDIQVVDSTLSGYYAAIYHPQPYSNLTISGSTLTGINGINIKGGQVTVIDSKIYGQGTDQQVVDPEVVGVATSGCRDTGDGIYIEADYLYPISLTISGNCEITHVASTAKAVRVYPEGNHVKVKITGGSFDSDVSKYLAEGYLCTESGGIYSVTAKD